MHELSVEVNGVLYKASYEVFDDTLVITFPDGTQRTTELRKLKPERAAMTHFLSYYGLSSKDVSPK